MRTRFLNTDYFNSETLDFLTLPLPHLPPSNLCNLEDLLCFDSVPSISLEIERLPVGNALSRFLAGVLPQRIDVGNDDFPNTRRSVGEERCFGRFSEKEAELLYEEREVESQRAFGSEIPEIEFPKKENGTTIDGKVENRLEVVQFETPELDQFLENGFLSEKKEMQILSEVPAVENVMDMLNPGLTVQYPYEIQESVYSVDDITPVFHMEQMAYSLEDAGSAQDQIHLSRSIFPLLEVDELSLGIFTGVSMEDGLLALLENTEPQHFTQKDDLMIDSEELLGSTDIDILECFSDHCLSKQCLESELACLHLFLEMDFIRFMETPYIQGNSAFHPGTSEGGSLLSLSPVLFQEFQFLDLDSSQFFEVLNSQTADEPETCDQMFREDMNFRDFNELIVSHELTLVDDTFKSLPVPVLSDHEKIRSLYAIVEEILAELKPHPLSASDGIYLDWHLLEEDKCNSDIYSTHKKMLEEIDTYNADSHLKSIDDGMLIFDFVFSGDTPNGPNMEESKEALNMPSGGISLVNGHLIGVASSKLRDDGCQKTGNGEVLSDTNAEKVSLLVESMSQFNDLDFFLNPRKAIAARNSEPAVKAFDTGAAFPVVSSSDGIAACASTVVQLQEWDIKLHQVKLSDNILALIDDFQKIYLAILENDTELKETHSFLVVDNFKLLSLPKQYLMDCIKKTSAQRTSSAHGDENIMAYVTLCAIKQMAWYLCFYGIHTTHLYADKLCRRLECLKFRLSFLQSLIEDVHGKADKEITKAHPSLYVIQGILLSNTRLSSLKVLIVAEQVFWWPLKRLLTSMKLTFVEQQSFHAHTNRPDACNRNEFTDTTMDALLHSDCVLVSHEHVSASFPFNKFGIILEYGGSYGSSRVSTISPKLVGFPHLHFVKVELEDCSVPKALCEGVDMPRNIGFTMEGESHSILALNENDQKLEELLNFVPVEEKHNTESLKAADKVEACCVPLPVPCMTFSLESKQSQPSMPSFPDTVIVVNTQNFDKEMIISRRSTYQRILAMEKEGAQVLERDLNLPVDVIISSAICLAWYDCRIIGKKATAPDEAPSCLPLCVENIAMNVLTSLSFTFSGCILVFEGESSFLGAVMESSGELYAAAASLGIDLQLFCSYSSEVTDEIILSCIGYATKLTRGLYPKMPESETVAESFLTKFPSINPLSAHAILSSGGMLVEFLEWSHERRIRAIRKYHVPDESVTLLSALCRYGEREDSKSGMTDCSSSVSSAPDSENYHCKIDSERKKRKYVGSPHKIEMPMDDFLRFEPLNQFTDGRVNPSGVSKPYDSWMSKGPEIFDEIKKPSLSLNDKLFGQKQGYDIAMVMNPSRVSKPYVSWMSKGPEISNEIKKHSLSLNDKLFGQKQGLDMATMKNLDWHSVNNSENLHGDFIGEVINLDDSPLLDEDFSSIANSISFSPLVPEVEKNPTEGNSKTARRLLFGKSSHSTFPMAAEINSNSDIWSSVKDHKQILREGINGYPDTDFHNDNMPLKHRKKILEEGSIQKSARNFHGLSFQEKEMPRYGGTPLSNAIRSDQLQQGSPWTIEFLNRIREKSRLRQQSLPCDTSTPCFGYSGNISKGTKRKSPSILEFFKYQGGSTPKKITERKRQKRSIQPSSSSQNEKTSASLIPTWTPIDKRARRTLSFAMNRSGSQTKLVWGDKNAHTLNRRFQS